ncbi:sigma-70 family RNA polymerase sigma factor [Salinimonas lutimaris]|uniref:sigma-70 family RNA polymerase sigma factor n=1 Tax=Salinimonas lutimaris TaxID=914153 RepID=UPI0010C144B0|nr:sigma-70 family RNA polymerase sigma factor [Salinimonas lutimaris]
MEQEELFPLLCRTAKGEQAAFAELYQRTSGQLFAVVLKVIRHNALAEEALQEAYIQIWHHASGYHQGRGTVLTWMVSIARYRALDTIRYRATRPEINTEHDLHPVDEQSPFIPTQDRLKECLYEIEQEQRQAIHLAYFHGMSHREVGVHLQSPLGTVKSWIRRGLEQLHRCLS